MAYDDILNNLKETPPRALNDHILVVDAMNTLIRSFSLLKAMNPSGAHVGGLVGFLRSLGYVTRIFDPTRVIIVWDGKGGSANRKNIDPNYKAQRATSRITHWGLYDTKEEETEALIGQLYRTQDYLECLPVHQLVMEKLEADDIMAWIAKKASGSNVKKCTIVSSDKDFLQLVDDTIEVYAPVKKKTFTKDNIFEELKVLPENYNIVKALLGDNSDNLQGVKGLGIKTILSEWKSFAHDVDPTLQDVWDHCEKQMEVKKPKKIFAKIIHNWDRVETNYELMNLHETVLDDREKNAILDTVKEEIPNLQTGAFLHLLDQDKIEGITRNTEGWLENFRGLTGYKK
jgi:DNA polymerase-1